MMEYAIVYRSNQLVECAVAALAEIILPKAVGCPGWDKIERLSEIRDATVFVLGTYWCKNDIQALLDQGNKLMLYDYSPNPSVGYSKEWVDSLSTTHPIVTYKPSDRVLGPLASFLEYVDNWCPTLSKAADSILRREKKLIEALDAYSLKQHEPKVEALVTGIYSSEEDQTGSKPVLQRLFAGELKHKKLIERGTIIHANNVQLARQTALKNSKRITLHDGRTARITVTAPHCIRLTAEQLLDREDADIAIVQRICLSDDKPDAVAYTLMTRDSTLDLTCYTTPYGGGGSAQLSGVSMTHTFELPHFCRPPPQETK